MISTGLVVSRVCHDGDVTKQRARVSRIRFRRDQTPSYKVLEDAVELVLGLPP